MGAHVEHGFPEKGPPQGHTVQAAQQLPIPPGFHGMGIAQSMQALIGRYHLGQYPCPFTVATGRRASPDDAGKGRIHAQLERMVAQGPGTAARQMEGIRRQHATGIRTPPQQGHVLTVPGKDAPAVGCQQTCRQQIATGTQYPFRGAASRRGELRRIQGYLLTHRCGRHPPPPLPRPVQGPRQGTGVRVHCP